jgi:hypothetical protein
VLSLAKKYGIASVDDACAAALEMDVCEYRFVHREEKRKRHLIRADSIYGKASGTRCVRLAQVSARVA